MICGIGEDGSKVNNYCNRKKKVIVDFGFLFVGTLAVVHGVASQSLRSSNKGPPVR